MLKNLKKREAFCANSRIPDSLHPYVKSVLTGLERPSGAPTQASGPKSKVDYLIDEVFSKYSDTATVKPEVRRQRAINKWLACERDNEATNERLQTISPEYNILPRVSYASFVDKAISLIEGVVGVTVPFEALFGAFSGGATTSKLRTESHPANKYLGKADITLDALGTFHDVKSFNALWSSFNDRLGIRIVEGNVLFTVPKNTEIDRCACKEPDLNMYLQKGLGDEIRRCLRRKAGINLNDQSINRGLAREGSITGALATIDLSSASDTVTTELVFQLMPILWFDLLNSIRSPVTIIDGERHENQMFSSMGNGFTFELESLLFWAIAKTTAWFTGTKGIISVYGDDLIIPNEMADDLAFVLGVLGFSVNPKKSFSTGFFRESCGGHFLHGFDITPFYIRKRVSHLVDVIHLANSIRKWSVTSYSILDDTLEDLWWRLANTVPKKYWGGHDFDDKSALVSLYQPERPMKLVEIVNDKLVDEDGRYIMWHDSRGQQSDSGNLSEISETSGRYRNRPRRRCWGVTSTIFLTELRAE